MKLSGKISSLVSRPGLSLAPLREAFGESNGIQILSAVLVLQLSVAGGLLWRSSSQANFAPAVQLVSVDASEVDEITIDDGEARVTLTKVDDKWRMDDEHKTPASADKVNQLVSDIANLNPGLPVASTAASHPQLEVAEIGFQRRVTLKTGDEAVVDVYLGTSPGFRKSHIRLADQDQVYAARLNTFDVPANQDGWLDKGLLAFDNVNGIVSDAIEVALVDERWTLLEPTDQTETHEVDQNEIASLVSRLKSLRVNGFAMPFESDGPADAKPATDDAQQPQDEVLVRHSITVVQDDSPVTLVLSRQGSRATIERSDVEGLFALPIATYDELTAEVIQQLLVEKSADTPEDAESPQG